ncbi:ABC transporter permease [Dactylosporangium sp. CA-233914]|uniref:ABC transporter permease n=1 Tax=Dactylosporangium sp. CA-233914 TaxID=3239934 RepID=UPI003D8C9A41
MRTTTDSIDASATRRTHRFRPLVRYTVKRLLTTIITLFAISVATLSMLQLLPGDVGRSILGQYATDEQVAQLNHQLGTDRPALSQYVTWLTNFLQGDWGESLQLGGAVRPLILERLTNSLLLAVAALVVVVPLSLAAGTLAALHRERLIDRVISLLGVSLLAIPEFVSGVVLLVIFGVNLGWFPTQSHVPSGDPIDILRQFTLPVIPLCLILFGYIARMMRASMIEVLDQHYTRTAVLKGLPLSAVIRRHVLRNSLLPVITVITGQVGYLVGGLVIVETLFSYPGIGNLAYQAAKFHDVNVLEASVLMVGAAVLAANFLGDILIAVLNPRVTLGRSS